MPRKIVVVEDDAIQLAWILGRLQEAFPDDALKPIASEWEFREKLESLRANPPALVIMDIMLVWEHPRGKHQMPKELEGQSSRLAGFRCMALLAGDPATKEIPIIAYSVLVPGEDFGPLPRNARFLSKSMDARPLIEAVTDLLS